MSTWEYCDNPEPHECHEWRGQGQPWFHDDLEDYDWPSHHCPGVKDSTELRVIIVQRDKAKELLDDWERILTENSGRHRRTISQFELNDDLAYPVPECGDTNGDGDCTRCAWLHAVCPKEWRP